MTAVCFLSFDTPVKPLQVGDAITLSGSEGRHAVKVSRLRVGEEILITGLDQYQVLAEVAAVGKDQLTATVRSEPTTRNYPVKLTLVQALAKGGRDELAIETATELGVDSVIPWQAGRSVSQWRGDKKAKGQAKWLTTVQAAVKQSRRSTIPFVAEVKDTAQLCTYISNEVSLGNLVLLLHEAATESFNQIEPAPEAQQVTLIVGPEGGIGAEESGQLQSAGAKLVRLGREVLRTSSAGPVGLAVLAAKLGRWD